MRVNYSKYDCIAGENLGGRKVVYLSGSDTVKLAKADSETTLPAIGFTNASALNGETVRIITNDLLDGFADLVAGDSYYLSQTNVGEITNIEPSSGIIIRLGVAKSSTELDIHILRLSVRSHNHSEADISKIDTEGLVNNAVTQDERAEGISDISTASTSYIDMPDMDITMITGNNPILFMFTASINIDPAGEHCYARLIVDGNVKTYNPVYGAGGYIPLTLMHLEILPSGTHTIKIQWKVTGGTAYNWASTFEQRRTLIAIELKK